VVTLVFLCRRRPDITHDEYVARVLGGHVPLALRHHPTLRRYVVNIVEEAAEGAPPLDSIAELGFASFADYAERLYDSPDGERIIARDVAGFLGGADAYVTGERDPRPTPRRLGERSPGVKLIAGVVRPPGVGSDESLRGWIASGRAGAMCAKTFVERRLGGGPDYGAFMWLTGADANALRGRLPHADGPRHVYGVAEYIIRARSDRLGTPGARPARRPPRGSTPRSSG
jgi:hypothetical protein